MALQTSIEGFLQRLGLRFWKDKTDLAHTFRRKLTWTINRFPNPTVSSIVKGEEEIDDCRKGIPLPDYISTKRRFRDGSQETVSNPFVPLIKGSFRQELWIADYDLCYSCCLRLVLRFPGLLFCRLWFYRLKL